MAVELDAARAGALFLALAPMAAAADTPAVTAPVLHTGDSWVLDHTAQRGTTGFTRQRFAFTIDRLNSDTMVLGAKPDGAPQAAQEIMLGLDWALKLLINDEQKTTARPFAFPMKVGDTWTADWIDPRRHGQQTSAHFRRTYKVVGWEDVMVPAGTFHALKIEDNGVADVQVVIPSVAQATAVGAPGAATTSSRVQSGGKGVAHMTTYNVIYYAPEVKHVVKEVDEVFDASNVMTQRDTDELVSFKLGS